MDYGNNSLSDSSTKQKEIIENIEMKNDDENMDINDNILNDLGWFILRYVIK